MNTAPRERRREPRLAATGRVEFTLSEPVPASFRGLLVDLSASGFRAAHQNARLETGQEVEFQHPSGRGVARVMWTRILAGEIESGFLVV